MGMPQFSTQLETPARFVVSVTADIVKARDAGKLLAQNMGFNSCKCTLIATVISELARNIVLYAFTGEIVMTIFAKEEHIGMMITAVDKGPGIVDMASVMTSGYSTSGGLGLGLLGVRKISDEFNIKSKRGNGTQVAAVVWLR